MKYKLVIFDLDGTILNTIDDLADAGNFINRKYGYPEHSIEEYKYFVGNGIPKLIERATPADITAEQRQKVLADYIEYYGRHCADKTAPYEGIVDCIRGLRQVGIRVAVNTNKVQSAAEELCHKYFPDCFDIISGSKPGIPPKPAPDGIIEILKTLGFSKNEGHAVCFVGDSDVDYQTGTNAGFDFIGVDWGFRGKAFLLEHGAKTVAMNAGELKELLTK